MAGASTSEILNYREVDPLVSTCGQPTEEQLRAVAADGFTAVINLVPDGDPLGLDEEADLARSLGLKYVHVPVEFSAPVESDLLKFFEAMEAHRHEKLLMHCTGSRRVTTFLGLYRMLRLDWDREHAFALMHEIWDPDETWTRFIDTMLETRVGVRAA
jgi:protein tyrosine phosphatase (PTP) superfamily phosphohydrolase (DUF442 family)